MPYSFVRQLKGKNKGKLLGRQQAPGGFPGSPGLSWRSRGQEGHPLRRGAVPGVPLSSGPLPWAWSRPAGVPPLLSMGGHPLGLDRGQGAGWASWGRPCAPHGGQGQGTGCHPASPALLVGLRAGRAPAPAWSCARCAAILGAATLDVKPFSRAPPPLPVGRQPLGLDGGKVRLGPHGAVPLPPIAGRNPHFNIGHNKSLHHERACFCPRSIGFLPARRVSMGKSQAPVISARYRNSAKGRDMLGCRSFRKAR